MKFVIEKLLRPLGIDISAKTFQEAALNNEDVLNEMKQSVYLFLSTILFQNKQEARTWVRKCDIYQATDILRLLGFDPFLLNLDESSQHLLVTLCWLIWRSDLFNTLYEPLLPKDESYLPPYGVLCADETDYQPRPALKPPEDPSELTLRIERLAGRIGYQLQTLSDLEVTRETLHWQIRSIDPDSSLYVLSLKSKPAVLQAHIEALRLAVQNSEKLKEKWAEEFKKQCVNTGNPNPFRARERSQGKPVILVVDHYVPTFDKDAGSKTTYQYLKMFLKMGYAVKFLGDNFLHEEPYSTALQQMGVEILYGAEYQSGIWDWILKNKDEIDFAYLNRPHIAVKYVDFLKKNTNIKIIYYGHDLHFLREYREYELTGDIQKKRESDYWKSIELSLMEKAAVSYYPSYVEVDAVHELRPEFRLKAITAYVYETFLEKIDQDFAKREGLLFVGGFAHPPNADAVLWFAKEVFPLIRNHCPVNFYIVGSKVTEEVQALDDPEAGIIVKGFVTEEELAKLKAL